jgi:hypothetical protein
VAQDDLLAVAERLTDISRGRPKQAYLRRAVSSTYYAVFHCLARCCADSLIGGKGAERSPEAWLHVYRSLDHGFPARQFRNSRFKSFPPAIQQFGRLFSELQLKRNGADYDPSKTFEVSQVRMDIDFTRKTLAAFRKVDPRDRRAFAAFVLLKLRD